MKDLASLAVKIRKLSLISIHAATSGHPGGALSSVDLLAYLFSVELKNTEYHWPHDQRHRFVLSKGHACPALYAAAANTGWIDEDEVITLRKLNSPLQGHPCAVKLPWVEASTGSLGQGFSAAIGMAMGLKYKKSQARVYALLGDGEMQEGQVWEGIMCAAQHKLNNLCAIIDYNKLQSDDYNENIIGLEPLKEKLHAFNWGVTEIDGHDFDDIERAFDIARQTQDKPFMIIANTVKGKGVSYMENHPGWHGSVKMSDENLKEALADLGEK